jgi:hypothetical protein
MREPWGEGTPWKNSVAFFTYLRGCLRKAWSTNPIKHNLIKKRRKQIPNPNPNGKKATVFGFTCEMCDNDYIISQGQVDHINPAGSLRKTEDIQGFVERLLYVTEDDLRLICKGCNSALSHADKMGITYAEAIIEKTAIELCKQKKDLQWLRDRGLQPASSQAKRRIQITEQLRIEQNDRV